MQKVRFIYNPKSGETVISEWLDHIIEIYQGHGYTVVPYRLCFGDTEETDMFDGVDQSYHHALIAGGDGTVNYVVNVMKRRGLDVPVAVLPTGTANDFAHVLGVPSDLAKACRRILNGEIRTMDLGRANDEYFVNVFSCGLFTDVSQKTPTILKNTFGKLAYYFGGLGELPNFRKMHISIESAHGNYEGSSLIFFVFNGRTAGQMRFAYLSEPDDGLLDVLLVRDVSRATMLRVIGKYKAGHYAQLPELIRHFRCRRVHIRCDRESEINLDGELMMSRDVTFEIAPQSIRFFYPRGLTYHAAAEQGGEHIAAT